MKIFEGRDYKYQIRRPIKEKHISSEYVKLANALKTLVDSEGQGVYSDTTKLEGYVSYAISLQHIAMISVIAPQINMLLSEERFVDEETVTE